MMALESKNMSENRSIMVKGRKPLWRLPAGATAGALLLAAGFVAPPAVSNALADEPSGRQIYKMNCAMCHKTGLNAAPKYGNKRAWVPILEKGKEKVYENTINGIGAMPPRGGKPNLTDEEIRAAVDFMVGAVGGWD